MAKGDCFTKAIEVVEGLLAEGIPASTLFICHGQPIYAGPPVEGAEEGPGDRYWHAWVEASDVDGWVVFDHSSDKEIQMARRDYYRLGQIKLADVKRYAPKDARHHIGATEHAGPWED